MQNVSSKWKENQQENIVPESFLEILYEIADFESLDQDSAVSEYQEYYSKVSQIVDGKNKDFQGYATLELHNWILDGSRKHLPTKTDSAVYGDVGYISNKMSNGYYRFEEKPMVEINFSQMQLKVLPAITITWSKTFNEYATEFYVSFYKGSQLIKRDRILNADLETIVEAKVKDYNKIQIEIDGWCLPYHRARVEEVFIGIRNKYTKKDILKLEMKSETDLISGRLPESFISFEVENLKNKYGEDGLYQYIFQKQRVDVKFGYKTSDKIEWISGGEYFLNNWQVELGGISAKFKATSLLEFLNNKYYMGVFQRKSLYQLATEVLEHANIPLKNGKKRWKIDDSLKSIYTDNPLPIATEKECLQIIANAGKCVLYTDREGFIRIEPISFIKSDTEHDYSVDNFNSYTYPRYTYIPVLKEINSYYKSYFESKSEEIYKATVSVTGRQEFWINYNRPAKGVNAVVSGATLVSANYYASACKLVLNATGTVNATVTITGKEMRTSENKAVILVSSEGENQDLKNPLISNSERAIDVANWVKSYLTSRKNVELQWRYDARADVVDRVNQSYDDKSNEMILSSLLINYNGGFKAIGKGRVLNGLA